MIDFEIAERLSRMHERLRSATYHEIRKDGHHKSSEGSIELSFCLPPVVSGERAPHWCIEVYSYLLCPDGRSETWFGSTAIEAIVQAEAAIEKWCFNSEMEMFDSEMNESDAQEPEE